MSLDQLTPIILPFIILLLLALAAPIVREAYRMLRSVRDASIIDRARASLRGACLVTDGRELAGGRADVGLVTDAGVDARARARGAAPVGAPAQHRADRERADRQRQEHCDGAHAHRAPLALRGRRRNRDRDGGAAPHRGRHRRPGLLEVG